MLEHVVCEHLRADAMRVSHGMCGDLTGAALAALIERRVPLVRLSRAGDEVTLQFADRTRIVLVGASVTDRLCPGWVLRDVAWITSSVCSAVCSLVFTDGRRNASVAADRVRCSVTQLA